MHLKMIFILILFSSVSACSSSSATSQKSVDTRACNAISYGNKNVDIQSIDGIYNKCMSDKKRIRNQQKDKAENLAIIEFFFSIFLPSESDN